MTSVSPSTYQEVCGNLMIYQQLEPICQPINCTFYMELYYNIPLPSLLILLIYYNRDSQTTRERVILCELNGTSNNTKC